MANRRTDIGLHVVTNGRRRGTISWEEFQTRTIAASLKPKPKNPGSVDNMRRDPNNLWGQPIPIDKRCMHIWYSGERKGKRCGRWAMKGAKRCPSHGGYRQNPEHPATVRRLNDVIQVAEHSAARRETRKMNPKRIAEIKHTLQSKGLPLSQVQILRGAQALEMDDNGRAYRRWLKDLNKSAPNQQLNARKATLRSKKQNVK